MLGFKKFINAQVANQRVEDHAVLNNLIQRVGESVVVEDRREALQELCNLLTDDPSAQSAFASVGFPTICLAIQMDRDDFAVVKTGLECISLAVAAEHAARDQQNARAAAVNAEQFARTDGAIPMLLNLLEGRSTGSPDVLQVKFLILQILHALLDANTLFSQQAILNVPTGVSQLVEMISESEVMRNEALLILQRLVEGNPDAQKVAVFSGCLDKLFSVMKEEEYLAGSIVVLDCLQLAANLLRGNLPNQRMYAELGYEKILHHVLQKEAETLISLPEDTEVPPERSNNIAAALDVLEACASDGSIERNALIPTLVNFAGRAVSPPWVRGAAWKCLAATALGSASARHSLEQQTVEITAGKRLSLAYVAMQDCANSPLIAGRQAAGDFFASIATPNVQSSTLKGLLTSTEAENPLQALYLTATPENLLISSKAAAALAPLIVNNPATKQQVLSAQVPQQQAGILYACAHRLGISVTQRGASPEGQELVANYGTLLIAWLPACPPAVQHFLQSISKTPFLVGVVMTENQFGAGSAVIRGICAVLLGLSCLYAPSGSAVDPKVLLKAVVDQIGLPRYAQAIDGFCNVLKSAASGIPQPTPPLWSSNAANWLLTVVEEVHRGVQHLAAGGAPPTLASAPPPPAAQIPPPTSQMHMPPPPPPPPMQQPPLAPPGHHSAQASPRAASAASNGSFKSPRAPSSPPPPLPVGHYHQHQHMLSAAAPGAATVAPAVDPAELENLRLQIDELKLQNARLEREAAEAKVDVDRLQQALSKAEADLEGLSTAYTALDSHATELQARLDKTLASPRQSVPNGQQQEDIEAMLQQVREEAEAEANAAMEDLLVCLGEEEAKVARLEAMLAEAQARR